MSNLIDSDLFHNMTSRSLDVYTSHITPYSSQAPEKRSACAIKTAKWREKQRSDPETAAKLKERGRINSRNYRLKKKMAKLAAQKKLKLPEHLKKKSRAMTSTEKTRAYRARIRATPVGVELLRARGREYSQRHRMKKRKQEEKIEVARALLAITGKGQQGQQKRETPQIVKEEAVEKIDTVITGNEMSGVDERQIQRPDGIVSSCGLFDADYKQETDNESGGA